MDGILVALQDAVTDGGRLLQHLPLTKEVSHKLTRCGVERAIAGVGVNKIPQFVGQ